MAHSGGLIYVDSTTTPATGVSVYDVQQVLNVSSNDVGTLCVHNNIKQWAKRKPIRVAQVAPITDAQRKSANYGFNINASSITGTPAAIATSNAATWYYQKPAGGASSPYRLSDFNGYSHNVVCPFSMSDFDSITEDIVAKAVWVKIDNEVGGVDTQHNVLVSDIFDLTQYSGYRLTLAVVDNTDSNNPKVIRYFFSPFTLNDPNTMPAGEDKIITVSTIPISEDSSLSEYNPVDGRTYTGVVMLTNRTFTQQEIEANAYRMGIYPNAMNNVTAVSLQLEEGINKFQFTYSEEYIIDDDNYIEWMPNNISVAPTNITPQITGPNYAQLAGTPRLFIIDDLTFEYQFTSSKMSEFASIYQNSHFQARIYIQGPHYSWIYPGSSATGPDDWNNYAYIQGSAQYEVTNWLSFEDFVGEYESTNIPTNEQLHFSDFAKYVWRIVYQDESHADFYPILLDADNLPTYISFQVAYRQQDSGPEYLLTNMAYGDSIDTTNDSIMIHGQWYHTV